MQDLEGFQGGVLTLLECKQYLVECRAVNSSERKTYSLVGYLITL